LDYSFFGSLPLSWLQAIGSFLGLLTFHFSKNDRKYIMENTEYAEKAYSVKLDPIACAKSAGMMLTDSLWIWQNPSQALKLTEIMNWDIVENAVAEGKGLLMLTPHLGAFEMIPRVLAEHFNATIIFKPAKQAWLNSLIEKGRAHPRMNFVPANLQGVRQIARALQKGEAVGILPDQVPSGGEGVWAPFFGKYAYTTVLPAKLANKNGVPTIIFSAIRKPSGKGWIVYPARISSTFSSDSVTAATQLNVELEKVIMKHPEQYLWSYNRYKAPLGVTPPQSQVEENKSSCD
jgi:KDO2-lipid IV(A) lauroyltransferase